MVIVDSSVWIDFLNGSTNPETEWLDLQLDRERVGLTSLILTEVLRGVRDEREAASVQAELLHFEIVEGLDAALSVEAAAHYRYLRQRGHPARKSVDLLIATLCIRDEHFLLHRNRDFDTFENHLGLQVVHP